MIFLTMSRGRLLVQLDFDCYMHRHSRDLLNCSGKYTIMRKKIHRVTNRVTLGLATTAGLRINSILYTVADM